MRHGIQIVASSDDHELEHAEISATPDFRETFPPHCMRGTKGAEKIPETQLQSPMIIEPDPIPHETLVRRLASHESDVLLRKHRFDVFSNPNTSTVIEAWDPTEIVLYGVTLDYCVRYALDGLIDLGIPTIHLVLDATKPIVPSAVDALVREVEEAGCADRDHGRRGVRTDRVGARFFVPGPTAVRPAILRDDDAPDDRASEPGDARAPRARVRGATTALRHHQSRVRRIRCGDRDDGVGDSVRSAEPRARRWCAARSASDSRGSPKRAVAA